VVDYVRAIGHEAGLTTDFEWDGERVRVIAPASERVQA
jgi:hypothetical protein